MTEGSWGSRRLNTSTVTTDQGQTPALEEHFTPQAAAFNSSWQSLI